MPRSPSDTADIFHGVLFGLSVSYTLWWYLYRKPYLKTILGKLCLSNLWLMVLRALVGIRLESHSQALCYCTVFLRVTLPITWMPQLNLVFQTQLFNNLFIKPRVAAKRLPKRLTPVLHTLIQLPGFINTALFLTHMQAFTNEDGYCAVTYDPARVAHNAVWTFVVALLPFFLSSAMLVRSGPHRHLLPEFTHLFRFSAVSNILLTVWAMWTHFESRLYPWQEWKLVYFTVVSVWCCVNSTAAHAYLVAQKARAEKRVKELNVNGLGSTTPSSWLMSTPIMSVAIGQRHSGSTPATRSAATGYGEKVPGVGDREGNVSVAAKPSSISDKQTTGSEESR